MSEHVAEILWTRTERPEGYSRAHTWRFDGGVEIRASSSPLVVPVPLSDASAVDPEEAFVASISSCHMLWYLALAEKRGYTVESYRDDAIGEMGRDGEGRLFVERVGLRPLVRYRGTPPSAEVVDELHAEAHHACFIANSVRTEIVVEPRD